MDRVLSGTVSSCSDLKGVIKSGTDVLSGNLNAENDLNCVMSVGVLENEILTQEVTVIPQIVSQTLLPNEGYYISQVNVEPIHYTEDSNAAGGITVTIGVANNGS